MMWSAVPGWLLSLAVYFVVGLRYRGPDGLVGTDEPHPGHAPQRTSGSTSCSSCPCSSSSIWPSPRSRRSRGCSSPRSRPRSWPSSSRTSPIVRIAAAVNTGYPAATGVEAVDRLLARGGLMSMMETQLVAFTAFSFGGIMQKTGMLGVDPGQDDDESPGKVGSLVSVTIGSCVVTAARHRELLSLGHPSRESFSGRPSETENWRPRTSRGSSTSAAASSCRSSPGAWPESTSRGRSGCRS